MTSKEYGSIMGIRCQIECRATGVTLVKKGGAVANSTCGVNSGKRGKVVGFSRQSSNRLRKLCRRVDLSHNCGAMCLTQPMIVYADAEEAWMDVSRRLSRIDGLRGLIWRKEVQRNGNVHYHLIVWASDGYFVDFVMSSLVNAWIDALYAPSKAPRVIDDALYAPLHQRLRQKAVYAHTRPGNCQVIGEGFGLIRYLCDHTSKHKDYQAKTTGRAWGKCGDIPMLAVDRFDIGLDTYDAVARALRKVSRTKIKKSKGVFGWKHSPGRKMSVLSGTTVCFGRSANGGLSADVRRYVDYLTGARG